MRHDLFQLNVQLMPRAIEPHQGEALYGLVRWFRPLHVLEIGSYHGYSTAWMAHALKQNGLGKLWAIDDGSGIGADLNSLQYNLERLDVNDVITLLMGKDTEVEWPSRIDLAFIDGCHTGPAVEWDWTECVKRGAQTIILHDTREWWGPVELAAKIRAAGEWDCIEDATFCGLTMFRRRPDTPKPRWTRETPPELIR